jgi:hypothetical protein
MTSAKSRFTVTIHAPARGRRARLPVDSPTTTSPDGDDVEHAQRRSHAGVTGVCADLFPVSREYPVGVASPLWTTHSSLKGKDKCK